MDGLEAISMTNPYVIGGIAIVVVAVAAVLWWLQKEGKLNF